MAGGGGWAEVREVEILRLGKLRDYVMGAMELLRV